MAKQYKVIVNGGAADKSSAIMDLAQFAGERGKALRLKAKAGVQYELQEVGRGQNLAPDYVKARRSGNNLEVTFEKGESPDLIIEDYYSVMPKGYNGLIGQAENGSYYEYIPENPSAQGLVASLVDGAQPTLVALGGTGVEVFELAGLPLVAAGFPFGLLGSGAAVAVGLGGGGGGGDPAPADTTISPIEIQVTLDANNDGFINRGEKGAVSKTSLTVRFDSSKAAVGDVLTLTAGGVTKRITLTAEDVKAGQVTSPDWSLPAEGATLDATATFKDAAGNQSQASKNAVLDTSALNGLTTKILTDSDPAGGNGLVGKPELQATGGRMQVELQLPADAKVGDVLLVTGTGSSPKSITLSGTDIQAGKITVDFTAPAHGVKFETTARLSDAAGNTSATVSDSVTISTQAAGAPTVSILEDANHDGQINALELQGTIQVNIKPPADAKVGDTLVLTRPDGITLPPFTLTDETLKNGISIDYAAPVNDGRLIFNAIHKTAAGTESSPGSATATLDRSDLLTGLSIAITSDKDNNAFINKAEIAESGAKVSVKIVLPTDAAVGDTLTVTGSGNITQTIILTDKHLSDKFVTTTFNPTADNTRFVTTAHLMDPAGNTAGPVQDQATMRVSGAGEPTVNILEDKNGDGRINASELAGGIDVEYGLPATAAAGDTLIITKPDGTTEAVVLQAADITVGKISRSYAAPSDGSTLSTSAQLKDAAGNFGATGAGSAKRDTTTPNNNEPLGLTIDVDNNVTVGDGLISRAEKGSATDTSLTATFDRTKVALGDVITFSDGTTTKTVALTQAMVDAGKVVSTGWALPAEGATLNVTATLKDAAGNTTPVATDTAQLDTTAPNDGKALGLKIVLDSDNDGYINNVEKGGITTTTTSLTASFDSAKTGVGDVVSFKVGDAIRMVTLSTQAMVDAGTVTSSGWNLPADGAVLTATATLSDASGNATPLSQDIAVVDTSGFAELAIQLSTDADNNEQIGLGELGSDPKTDNLTVVVTLPDDVKVGDRLLVTGTGNPSRSIVLTETNTPGSDVTVLFTAPPNGITFVARAQLTDAAGNFSSTVSDAGIINTQGLGAPFISILEDGNNDGHINAAELSGSIQVSIRAPSGAEVGGRIQVFGPAGYETTHMLDARTWRDGILIDYAVPGADGLLEFKGIYYSPLGNWGATGSDTAILDRSELATGMAVSISTDADSPQGNGIVSASELSSTSNKVAVKVDLPRGAVLGDTLTIEASGNVPQTILLTHEQVRAGFVTARFDPTGDLTTFKVSAHVRDLAGNTSPVVSDIADIHTSLAQAPLVNSSSLFSSDALLDYSGLQNLSSHLDPAFPTVPALFQAQELSLAQLLDTSESAGAQALDTGLAMLDKAIQLDGGWLPQWGPMPQAIALVDTASVYSLFPSTAFHETQHLIDQAMLNASLTM